MNLLCKSFHFIHFEEMSYVHCKVMPSALLSISVRKSIFQKECIFLELSANKLPFHIVH